MKRLAFLAMALTAHLAWAGDITARIAAGRAASSTPAGSKFDQSLIPLLGKAGNACDPPGARLPTAELGQFTLVGDITPSGALQNVEVAPQTPVAQCFAAQLLKNRYDPPPRPGLYPILVLLTVNN